MQLRGELLAFLLPVQHQRRRADDEAGQLLPALLHGQQVAEHLHSLTQTHIVGQNAAHAVAIQCAQPAVAVPLVFAQGLLQGERRGIFAVPHGVEAAADAPESIVPVEPQAVLPRKRPVQRGRAVERQSGVAVLQLCAGKFQCVVQLVQPFQTVVQPQQTAVPQAVVALFLVQGLQKLPQLLHREGAGVHFQVQHAAVHRHPYRNFRRGGLQVAEGIGLVHLAHGQQGGNALFQQLEKRFLPGNAVMPGLAALGFQIGFQQPLCPVLGAGIPQKIRRHRLAGGYPVLAVQKDRVGRDGKPPVGVQIKLHHRFQRDLVQQQPVGVHDVDPVAQLRQHIAAKGGGIRAGKEQTAPAKSLQHRQHPAAFLPLHPPEGGFAQQISIVQPLHPAERRGTAQLHAALAALHLQADDRQTLFKGIAAHNALGGVKLHKGIQPLAGQRQTARRAFLPAGAHRTLGFKFLPGAHLTAQQPQQLLRIRGKGVPPVHKRQRLAVADAFALLDRIQKLRDAFYQILPPADAVRDPQPQPDTAIVRRKLRFQQSKAGALGGVLGLGLRILPLVALQQQLGLIVGLRLLTPPLAAKQHIQPGAVTVLAGLRVQPGNAPLHPGDALRLFSRGRRVLFRVL